jgi:hypothetical protein
MGERYLRRTENIHFLIFGGIFFLCGGSAASNIENLPLGGICFKIK